ncbi:class I SAM-dependent methyltransferase [Azonexus sp.]|uniref:class I SAM-dependent methyltransferase n=1 Tax=Azonexus sp. TaxID=1872668 RepID=UPI00281E0EDA|nr:class I SAM-dependent methyltransferase [Azonexus sp.]MDR1995095.1 class I SAM-dependent methyltransferase [Azonexus sp.]
MTRACPCCGGIQTEAAGIWSRCRGCGHRWRLPGETATVSYQRLIARNDTTSPDFRRKLRDRLDTLEPLLPAAGTHCRVLEVGCAEGHLGEALKALRPMIYDGIEISRDAEAAATRIDTVYRQPAAEVQAPAYDWVLAFHVLEHIADPAAELSEWRRLLASGGRMVLEVPHESGHPLVASDENPEHLHQFTLPSLLCLLQRAGFSAEAVSSGHYESAVHPDSIRVTARQRESAESRQDRLVARFNEKMGDRPFLVYGIGGDFRNYVLPVLDRLPVLELLDSSAEKWGAHCAGHVIGQYDPARHRDNPILACSIRFQASILESLREQGVPDDRIVTLEEVYG